MVQPARPPANVSAALPLLSSALYQPGGLRNVELGCQEVDVYAQLLLALAGRFDVADPTWNRPVAAVRAAIDVNDWQSRETFAASSVCYLVSDQRIKNCRIDDGFAHCIIGLLCGGGSIDSGSRHL